eukprot:XP_001705412.1 Hypothetical protein GL50803_32270 [Giardia lamblia ATCC 50803]
MQSEKDSDFTMHTEASHRGLRVARQETCLCRTWSACRYLCSPLVTWESRRRCSCRRRSSSSCHCLCTSGAALQDRGCCSSLSPCTSPN